jgi:hypothetical protein
MMEAARTSETLVNFYQTTGATTQKTAIFVLIAVRASNPIYLKFILESFKVTDFESTKSGRPPVK